MISVFVVVLMASGQCAFLSVGSLEEVSATLTHVRKETCPVRFLSADVKRL